MTESETMSEADCDRMERAAMHVEAANELCRRAGLEIDRLKDALRYIAEHDGTNLPRVRDPSDVAKAALAVSETEVK